MNINNLLLYGNPDCKNYFDFWENPDDYKTYKKHLKTKYLELKENNWLNTENEITYSYNEWGFRTPTFDTTGGIMFLGCSHTVGVGLRSEQTFAHIVSERLKLPMYRMGVSGGSNDAAFRIALHWIPILKPTYVVLLATYNNRIELLSKHNITRILAQTKIYEEDSYYKNFILYDANKEMLMKKNILGIQNICMQQNATFISSSELNVTNPLFIVDLARDLLHPGPLSNLKIADVVTETLTKIKTQV